MWCNPAQTPATPCMFSSICGINVAQYELCLVVLHHKHPINIDDCNTCGLNKIVIKAHRYLLGWKTPQGGTENYLPTIRNSVCAGAIGSFCLTRLANNP